MVMLKKSFFKIIDQFVVFNEEMKSLNKNSYLGLNQLIEFIIYGEYKYNF